MKKKKEIIIAISAILFTLTLFIRMPQALQLVLILVAYVLVGKDTVLLAVKNIERGDFLDENFLMTVATLGAILIGEYPEAVAVMLLYEIGELFQGYAINKSRKSIADMMDIKPEYANVIRDNKSEKVDPDEVQINEIIEIKPGERVPLDAIIIKGESTLDTSALTGESLPVEVREGATILSGCININALIIAKVNKKEALEEGNKILKQFNLDKYANKYPQQLSGGMRQRVALIRTYMFKRKIFLLDEAFSALDAITKKELHKWYLNLKKEFNLTTLLITHDIEEAVFLSDRIYILGNKPGEIIGEIKIEIKPDEDIDFQRLIYKKQILNAHELYKMYDDLY